MAAINHRFVLQKAGSEIVGDSILGKAEMLINQTNTPAADWSGGIGRPVDCMLLIVSVGCGRVQFTMKEICDGTDRI